MMLEFAGSLLAPDRLRPASTGQICNAWPAHIFFAAANISSARPLPTSLGLASALGTAARKRVRATFLQKHLAARFRDALRKLLEIDLGQRLQVNEESTRSDEMPRKTERSAP